MDFFITEYIPIIIDGFFVTLQMTYFGAIIGLIMGTLLAIGDLYGGKIISTAIKFYVEFFRGSPIISQLFIFYFSIPTLLHVIPDSFTVGLLVFALNSAAYQKGYIKGAMEAVYGNQMVAARSLGLSKVQAIRYVVLPQALRIVIPSWGNEFCSLGKSTAALLTIGVTELAGAGRIIASHTWRVIETYSFVALIYLLWISTMMKLLDILYNKVRIPGIEITT